MFLFFFLRVCWYLGVLIPGLEEGRVIMIWDMNLIRVRRAGYYGYYFVDPAATWSKNNTKRNIPGAPNLFACYTRHTFSISPVNIHLPS
jgi:hypothetical protein